MPIYGENLQILFFRKQEADDLETLYTASGTRVLPMFSYDDPGLNSTIFMRRSNLLPNASAWAKAYTVLLYFQVYSNSAYPQHSSERYRTSGPLV